MTNFTSNKNGTAKLTAAKTASAVRAIYSEFLKPESSGLGLKKKLRLVVTSLLLVLLSSMGSKVFATAWTTKTADADPTLLASWWNGTSSPTSFLNRTWNVLTGPMKLGQ